MTISDIITYGTWGISAASAIAAVTPPAAVAGNPVYKVFSQVVDFLALNFGHAKS